MMISRRLCGFVFDNHYQNQIDDRRCGGGAALALSSYDDAKMLLKFLVCLKSFPNSKRKRWSSCFTLLPSAMAFYVNLCTYEGRMCIMYYSTQSTHSSHELYLPPIYSTTSLTVCRCTELTHRRVAKTKTCLCALCL